MLKFNLSSQDEKLYEELRKFRLKKAKELDWHVYYIIDNKQLLDITKIKPRSKDEFIFKVGLGHNKYELIGEEIINIINKFIKENDS